MKITIARLRAIKKLQNEIDDLERMKLHWYRPVKSPTSNGTHSTTPSDPTAQAFAAIERINDKIAEIQIQLAEEINEVMTWLYEEQADPKESELRRIIICHYIDGMSWETTTRHVLGYYGTESARQRVYRYFNEKL
jgi:predicted transcriptional regulator